jgi:FkbM family methyltransferase
LVTARGIFQVLSTTKNFWVAISWINPEKRARVIFRNGCSAELNSSEYRSVLYILSKGYSVEVFGDLFCFAKGKIKIMGPLSLLDVLSDPLEETYSVDCKNKTVLDVGGFIGETACLFSAEGAAKVIIYEPVISNHEFIKLNIALNNVNAEVHKEGIGEADGFQLIHYDKIGTTFGLTNTGKLELCVKIRNIRDVIQESSADIAKFDCEGAESTLTIVPTEVLRLVDYYIIEIHSLETKNALVKKFMSSGFVIVKDIPMGDKTLGYISTVFFKKIPDV